MKNIKQILCFGSLNIDYIYKVRSIVRPGETIRSLSINRNAGGKGSNQSMAAVKAGATVHHAGKIGNDGEWMLDEMMASGINVSNIEISSSVSGHAVIQVDDAGENAICLFGGTNRSLTREYIDSVLNSYASDTVLMLQNEVNEIPYLIQQGLKRNMPICLNPSPITDELLSLDLTLVDIIIVNELEGCALSGLKEPYEIIQKLHAQYPKGIVILTLGSRGSIAIKPGDNEPIIIPSESCDCIDSTAAGDTFAGYVLAGLTMGHDLEIVLTHASRAAEHCVGISGAQSSIPFRSELNL